MFAMRILLLAAGLGGGLLAPVPVFAASCEAPEYRQFDFWLGEWEVRNREGRVAGVNRIEREYGGCVVHERYRAESGYSGESLNIFDAGRGVWHQTWVDTAGTLLRLEGGLRDGAMVLEGRTRAADGRVVRHRITWTPNEDGNVRQLWESTDAEGAWTTTFDGRYTRR